MMVTPIPPSFPPSATLLLAYMMPYPNFWRRLARDDSMVDTDSNDICQCRKKQALADAMIDDHLYQLQEKSNNKPWQLQP